MGSTSSTFTPVSMRIGGRKRQELLRQQNYSQMGAIAYEAGKADEWCFQLDNLPDHKVKHALASIEKRPRPWFRWPGNSSVHSVLDYFVWAEIRRLIDETDASTKNNLRSARQESCGSRL